jgi:pimeloyl-ACP methyl ester carboxylesterase
MFDKIILPDGYDKEYIEWLDPQDESIEEYAHRMAAAIATDEPFIMVGYSMGGFIMQEINRFLKPEKNILISSAKLKDEIPLLFRFASKTHLNKHIVKFLGNNVEKFARLLASLMFSMTPDEISLLVSFTSKNYLQWAVYQVTEWKPKAECHNLYHIHGTKDRIFPFRRIKNAFVVEGGDHIMIYRKPEEVSRIITQVLLL